MYFNAKTNRNLAEKLFAHIRNSTTDQMDEVFEYDLSIYSDSEIAKLEREKIFEKMPMMALHSSQLPEPNTFVTVQLNRSNVLVTRDKDGLVRAFLNVCRHRGTILAPAEGGKRNRFSCPYHGWTYTNEGELVGISFSETTGLTPCAERNLIALPVEERHGFIWIVENPKGAIDIAAHLGPDSDEVLGGYGLDKYFCYREHIFDFAQNWKIMMDGLIDGYHVQFVHGPTIRPYFYLNIMARADLKGDHATTSTPRRTIDKILAEEEPGQSPLDPYAVFGNMFSPNVSMQLHPHHVEFWTIYQNPADPGRSRVHLRFLTPKKEYDERGQNIIQKNWDIAAAAIVNEDVPVGDSIQRAANMPNAGKAILGLNEVINQQFHRNYQRYMEAD